MSKKPEHSFSSVLSINPYKNVCLSGISSFLSETSSPEYKKDQYVLSYLNTQGFINAQVSITKNIPEEDLYDAINNKIYDELGLDQAVMYQVQFIELFNNLDEDNRTFHVFIVDPLTLTQTYQSVIEKVKYIDTIVPAPLLLKSLYSKEIIEGSGVHCFIYFQENDTFVTVYNEKEFLYTKSIKFSFLQMHERFCELYGERVEYEDFLHFIQKENLKETLSDYKEYIIKLYKEIFSNINDIVTYVKRAFEVDKIEHVYIGSQIATLTKLDEMAEAELGLKCSDFSFDYGYESNDSYIDQLHALMHLYAALDDNEKYQCNFSIYHRPPKFTQRESGKLIMLVAASLLIAFLYPSIYWSLAYAQSFQYEILEEKYIEVHNIRTTREAIIKNKEAEKAKVAALLQSEQENYDEKKATLMKIHDVKVNYPMKAKLLNIFISDINLFKVQLEALSYYDYLEKPLEKETKQTKTVLQKQANISEEKKLKTFVFHLVASSDKNITNLLEHYTKKFERKFKFSLEEIVYEDESKKYFAELKVELL